MEFNIIRKDALMYGDILKIVYIFYLTSIYDRIGYPYLCNVTIIVSEI